MSLYRLYSGGDRRGETGRKGVRKGERIDARSRIPKGPQGGWNLSQRFAIFRTGMGQRSWNH